MTSSHVMFRGSAADGADDDGIVNTWLNELEERVAHRLRAVCALTSDRRLDLTGSHIRQLVPSTPDFEDQCGTVAALWVDVSALIVKREQSGLRSLLFPEEALKMELEFRADPAKVEFDIAMFRVRAAAVADASMQAFEATFPEECRMRKRLLELMTELAESGRPSPRQLAVMVSVTSVMLKAVNEPIAA